MTALDDLAALPFHTAGAQQRARMLSVLANTELYVALNGVAADDQIHLRMFPYGDTQVALACDAEDRLPEFLGGPVEYASMPGRLLAGLLQTARAGLLVNPDCASEMLLDAEALVWLTDALAEQPHLEQARLHLTGPAAGVVAALAEPLASRLLDFRGLIDSAALAGVGQSTAPESHVLLIRGAQDAPEAAIAKALAETLAFLPAQPGGVDILFSDIAPPPGAVLFHLETERPRREIPRDRPPRLR